MTDQELATLLAQAKRSSSLPYIASPKQIEFHSHPARGLDKAVLYGGAIGGGKFITDMSLISTPYGWKPIGESKVGDKIHNPDGSVQTIIQVHPQGEQDVYRMTFHDGTSVDVGLPHLWLAKESMKMYKKNGKRTHKGDTGNMQVFTTEQLKQKLDSGKKMLIPVTEPVRYTRASRWPQRTIDPYLLGVLLGDGHISERFFEITCNDEDIPKRIERTTGIELTSPIRENHCPQYRSSDTTVMCELKRMGLLSRRAWEKFIPEEYQYGTIEERWELLRGLMDTDGTASKEGKIYYCTTSEQLAKNIQLLVESLGGIATITTKTAHYTWKDEYKEGRIAYILYIKLPDPSNAFHLERKKERCKIPQNIYRTVASIEYVGREKCTCITVNHPNGLFLTEHFIVTHNSYALCGEAIRECQEVPGNRVLLARKDSVNFKKTTLMTLMQLLPRGVTHRKVEQQFIFPNGSTLMYTGLGTEKDNEKLRGLEIGFLGIDEASEIDRLTFRTACSRLRWAPAREANRIKVRLCSNPAPGWLKEDFIDSPKWGPKIKGYDSDFNPILELDDEGNEIIEQKYFYIRATMKDNPYVGPEYIAENAGLWSDDPVFREAFLSGDWNAFTGDDQVLDTWKIQKAMERTVMPGTPVIWGLDVARFGSDSTVLFECAGSKFRMIKQWKKRGLDTWGPEIIDIYKDARVKPSVINIDDIGLGGTSVEYFTMNGLPARGINVTRASKRHANKYGNMKAELWWNLRHRFDKEELDIPEDTGLKAELSATRYEYVSGRILIPDKEKIKANLGRSPDKADALVLSSWGGSISFTIFDTIEELEPTLPTTSVGISEEEQSMDKTKMALTRLLRRR